jgi:hypothetical protein
MEKPIKIQLKWMISGGSPMTLETSISAPRSASRHGGAAHQRCTGARQIQLLRFSTRKAMEKPWKPWKNDGKPWEMSDKQWEKPQKREKQKKFNHNGI